MTLQRSPRRTYKRRFARLIPRSRLNRKHHKTPGVHPRLALSRHRPSGSAFRQQDHRIRNPASKGSVRASWAMWREPTHRGVYRRRRRAGAGMTSPPLSSRALSPGAHHRPARSHRGPSHQPAVRRTSAGSGTGTERGPAPRSSSVVTYPIKWPSSGRSAPDPSPTVSYPIKWPAWKQTAPRPAPTVSYPIKWDRSGGAR